MTPEEFLEILHRANNLKINTRHNWTMGERKESVADHSWRIALMAMLLSQEDEFKDVDMNKVIRMCLIHDLGEAFTGDIPAFEKNHNDETKEDELFFDWVKQFPKPQKDEWNSLLKEMIALETKEAKTYKSLDKLEALIAHDEADINTWLPLEYDLQMTYGKDIIQFSPYLTSLREAIDKMTQEKIEKESTQK
jgi:putative hydrolases of HD superfamily